MWRTKVPDFPFGDSGVRYWLIARALFGFFGLFCLYCKCIGQLVSNFLLNIRLQLSDSVHYLPLAEATVLRFLVPIATAWLCSVFLGLKFTRREFVAGLVALVGVILIAHPKAIFGNAENHADTNMSGAVDDVNSTQHIIAVVVSLLGVFGASGAYTMIRVIGDRAHALISVSYFAMISTVGSTTALLIIPGIRFTMPQDALEWILLILLGVLGFVLQFLLTVGLQLDKSSKATSMLYTQVLFAIMFDWTIWNVFPDSWSLFGGAIVIASTLWSALQKPHKIVQDGIKTLPVDEESALLGSQTEESEEVVQSRASTHT